MKIKIQFTLY